MIPQGDPDTIAGLSPYSDQSTRGLPDAPFKLFVRDLLVAIDDCDCICENNRVLYQRIANVQAGYLRQKYLICWPKILLIMPKGEVLVEEFVVEDPGQPTYSQDLRSFWS
jgi:hypothetical protein